MRNVFSKAIVAISFIFAAISAQAQKVDSQWTHSNFAQAEFRLNF